MTLMFMCIAVKDWRLCGAIRIICGNVQKSLSYPIFIFTIYYSFFFFFFISLHFFLFAFGLFRILLWNMFLFQGNEIWRSERKMRKILWSVSKSHLYTLSRIERPRRGNEPTWRCGFIDSHNVCIFAMYVGLFWVIESQPVGQI